MIIKDDIGPIDRYHPAQYAALGMEKAAPVALSIPALRAGYQDMNAANITRIKRHFNLTTDNDAYLWLFGESLRLLARRGKKGKVQLVEEDGLWRFADGITFDDLRFDGKKLVRPGPDLHRRLGDPFSPLTGDGNVRAVEPIETLRKSELYESMKELGWVDHPTFHAVIDERGVVLVGHRRLACAKDLGIEPRIREVALGVGDEADLKRYQLAIVSNIGAKEMTKRERQNQVAVLAGPDHNWTQMSIAEALGVSQATIASDIAELKEAEGLIRPDNPERGGRPARPSLIEGLHAIGHPATESEICLAIGRVPGGLSLPIRVAAKAGKIQQVGSRGKAKLWAPTDGFIVAPPLAKIEAEVKVVAPDDAKVEAEAEVIESASKDKDESGPAPPPEPQCCHCPVHCE